MLLLIEQISGHRPLKSDEAESETCSQLTGKQLLYTLVEGRCAEAPDLADLQGANHATPRRLLERLEMDSHDRRLL